MLLGGLVLGVAALVAVLAPAWWIAGRLEKDAAPFYRLLIATGIACVGYVSIVNLVGRAVRQSTIPAGIAIAACVVAAVALWRTRRAEIDPAPLWYSRREWIGVVLVALVLGFPQWLLAVSSPFWDEVASSSIHLTAANQFAEGVFPPRHNALPDVIAKYHYGFIILSGTVHWLTGLRANVSVDVVSTLLWLFAFLFIVHWLRSLGFERAPSLWGAVAALLGGGFAWAFVRRIEAYSSFDIAPDPSLLVHKYSDALGYAGNLAGDAKVPSMHLRNLDGTMSNLPWDVAAQLQQHAVSMGLALSVFALWAFVSWQRRETRRTPHFVLTIASFALLFLAHAVFGGVAAVTGGLMLLAKWLRVRTRRAFIDGAAFGIGIAIVAVAHGGFLSFGAVYGASADVFTLRHGFGYSRGGVAGFLLWNIAGFGLPLLLALAAWITRPLTKSRNAEEKHVFALLSVFAVFSYLLPQLAYYSSDAIGVEATTEVSKFFFTARLGFALLSAWAVALIVRRMPTWVLLPAGATMVVTPLMFVWVQSTQAAPTLMGRPPLGFYFAPYKRGSVEQQIGDKLRGIKHSNRDVFFDEAFDETAHGFINELFFFSGSVFEVTPSRYERTGFGYRLSTEAVAERYTMSGRMAQLRPGAADACACRWFYARPDQDIALLPAFVRARFARAVSESALVERIRVGRRALFEITEPRADLNRDLDRVWRPHVVMQANSDWNGDGRWDLVFYDYEQNRLLTNGLAIAGPPWMQGEVGHALIGRFAAGRPATFLLGRATDTEFRRGRRIEDLVEQSNWGWTARAGAGGSWSAEQQQWGWNSDIPLVSRRRAGADVLLAYHSSTGEWFQEPFAKVAGPSLLPQELPAPFTGRFLRGSDADVGVRSRADGTITIQSLSTGQRVNFQWGLGPNEVLVPGDWDGDGYDEFAIYNETNQHWYWRRVPDGAITQFEFGVPGAVPLPADYNMDGKLDPAYWVPGDNRIYVSFSQGRRVDAAILAPPHAFPAFVNVF